MVKMQKMNFLIIRAILSKYLWFQLFFRCLTLTYTPSTNYSYPTQYDWIVIDSA